MPRWKSGPCVPIYFDDTRFNHKATGGNQGLQNLETVFGLMVTLNHRGDQSEALRPLLQTLIGQHALTLSLQWDHIQNVQTL